MSGRTCRMRNRRASNKKIGNVVELDFGDPNIDEGGGEW